MSDDALEQLARRAAAHDAAAWDELYRVMYRPLMGYAVRRLGDTHRAEDAVSETMARAVDGVHRHDAQVPIDVWLFGIARNVVREQWRRDRRDRRLDDRARPSEPIDDEPADLVIDLDDVASTLRAMDELGEQDRETLELRVVADMTAEQVGQVQGRSASAVRTAQHRALARLRELLAKGERHV